jgi:Fe-S cluster assembly iron-binding protein IscA
VDFLLTEKARERIHEKYGNSNENLVIIISQINKQACSGSYLDYYLELTTINGLIKPENYLKFYSLKDNKVNTIDIYIEKRIMEEFDKEHSLLIDIEEIKKFNEIYISFILKE